MRHLRFLAAAGLLFLSPLASAGDEDDPRDEPPPVIYSDETPVGSQDPGAMFMVGYLDQTDEGRKFRASIPENLKDDAEEYLRRHPEYRANPKLLEALLTVDELAALQRGRATANGTTPPHRSVPSQPRNTAGRTLPVANASRAPGTAPVAGTGRDSGAGPTTEDHGPIAALAPSTNGKVQGQGAAAASHATKMAAGMKALMLKDDGLAGPGGGPEPGKPGLKDGQPAPPPPGAAGAAHAGPGTADDISDLRLAESAHRASFESTGLKIGTGPDGRAAVVHSDGSVASTTELTGLRAAIASQPSALVRNPSYLDPSRGGIAPRDFARLKSDYTSRSELRETEFKDIALKDNREFQYDKSCSRASGECNKHSEKSYKKGEDVAPRTLKSIRDSIRNYLDKASDDGLLNENGPSQGVARRQASGLSRLKALMSQFLSPEQSRPPVEARSDRGGDDESDSAYNADDASAAANAVGAVGGARGAERPEFTPNAAATRRGQAATAVAAVIGIILLAGAAWAAFSQFRPCSPVGRREP